MSRDIFSDKYSSNFVAKHRLKSVASGLDVNMQCNGMEFLTDLPQPIKSTSFSDKMSNPP